jgi:O-antigen/teichoic acid export membrane protein
MRHWKTVSTSLATLSARLSSVGGMLVINGVANRHLTHDQFGLWSILFSINLLTNGLDLGFRFTLGNRLAALGSRGAEGEAERRETFLAIVIQQTVIAVLLALMVLLIFPLLPWARWFKITDALLAAQTQHLMPIVVAIMITTLPVSLIWAVFFAYHEIKLASFLSFAVMVLQTALFVLCVYHLDFTWLMLVYFTSNFVIGVFLTAYALIRRRWRFALVSVGSITAITRSLAPVSFHSFLANLAGITAMILGPLVSGAVSGLTAAGDFTLIQKLFSLLISSHQALLAPISPAITLESHSGDWDAVRRRLRICVFWIWPAVFLGLGAIILGIHPLLIHLWAGQRLVRYPLATLLLIWAICNGFANTFGLFLGSLGLVKIQAVVSLAMVLPSIFLSALFSHWFGSPGIALAMVVCTLPAALIWPFYTRTALRFQKLRV